MGAPQIAAIERIERLILRIALEPLRQALRLYRARVIKRNVFPALDAARAIPVSFAVADEPYFSHGRFGVRGVRKVIGVNGI
jgi:hypothetical protein